MEEAETHFKDQERGGDQGGGPRWRTEIVQVQTVQC